MKGRHAPQTPLALDTCLTPVPAGGLPAAAALLRRLAAAVEAALSMGQQLAQPAAPEGPAQGQQRHRQRVHGVQLVRARNMYGYHADDQVFAKILL